MKTKLSLLSLAVCAVFSTGAFAQQGTITFQGEVFDSGCTVDVNGGGPTGTVVLSPVSPANLLANATAGERDFDITLSGCTQSTYNNVWAYFSGVNVDANGRLNNIAATPAANVKLEISRENNGARIVLGPTGGANVNGTGPTADQGATFALTPTTPPNGATLRYGVRYFADGGNAGVGMVNSQVTYNLIFH